MLIELTVPWEEGCDKTHERDIFEVLRVARTMQNWSTLLFLVEVI